MYIALSKTQKIRKIINWLTQLLLTRRQSYEAIIAKKITISCMEFLKINILLFNNFGNGDWRTSLMKSESYSFQVSVPQTITGLFRLCWSGKGHFVSGEWREGLDVTIKGPPPR